jgi:hypothetical protein
MTTAHPRFGRKFPWALALSAVFSTVFVVVLAALIAFMQYQTRLQHAQPAITAGQLVYYVEAEKKIADEASELAKYSEAIGQYVAKKTLEEAEIDYRIDRICELFTTEPISLVEKKCDQFLRRIPFKGTTKMKSVWLQVPQFSKTASESPPIDPISDDLLDDIVENFKGLMGSEKFGDFEVQKLVSIFESDIARIAWLNQDYALRTLPQLGNLASFYLTTCNQLIRLTKIVSTYHPIPEYCDLNYASNLVTLAGSEKPAEGGQIQADNLAGSEKPAEGGQIQADNLAGSEKAAEVGSNLSNKASKELPPSETPSAAQLSAQRTFELVSHYRFYDRISLGMLRDILISPNDFLALMLVCVGGILGALLRIVFSSYISGEDPTLRGIVISPILGLICSLVIYNLFRAGFIVITDRPQNTDTATLSPFVIALLAMAAGLLSERAIDLFRRTFGNWLGSIEASQGARWGVNLQREMSAQRTTVEKLSERLGISATKVRDWVQEKEAVPIDKQHDLALALNVPARRLFTDVGPTRTGGD